MFENMSALLAFGAIFMFWWVKSACISALSVIQIYFQREITTSPCEKRLRLASLQCNQNLLLQCYKESMYYIYDIWCLCIYYIYIYIMSTHNIHIQRFHDLCCVSQIKTPSTSLGPTPTLAPCLPWNGLEKPRGTDFFLTSWGPET